MGLRDKDTRDLTPVADFVLRGMERGKMGYGNLELGKMAYG